MVAEDVEQDDANAASSTIRAAAPQPEDFLLMTIGVHDLSRVRTVTLGSALNGRQVVS